MTLTNIHGNLRFATNHRDYFAYQVPFGGQHATWRDLFSSDNLDDLKRLACQHYCKISDANPAKFKQMLSPLN